MQVPPNKLRHRENQILDALEGTLGDGTFRGKLYRDGVPSPQIYVKQPVRVVFVFREPNMRGVPWAEDMRDAVHDKRFRPLRCGKREDRSTNGWWNAKVGLFAHAVGAALAGRSEGAAYREFSSVLRKGEWNHAVVNRFGYMQIKKVGGRGTANPSEICEHAKKYATTLARQLELYRPHVVIGCGIGAASPAQLLAQYVLSGGIVEKTSRTGAKWWRFRRTARPVAMLQLYHPSKRGSRASLYSDVWRSVDEVARVVGLPQTRPPR
jgi:hypothetical protein